MTAILTTLFASGAFKWVGAGLVGLIAIVGAWFHGKSTGATAATQAAQAKVDAATTQTAAAQQQAATAQADAQQAQAETAAVQVAAKAQADAQALPDDQLDAELAKLGVLRKE